MNVDIAKRLADRRRQEGLTQEGLAEQLNVTRQAVSKWERSESSPDTDNLIALAALYGVSLDELLYTDAEGKGTCNAETTAQEQPKNEEASAPQDTEDSWADPIAGFTSKDGKVHIGPGGIHVEDDQKFVHINWQDGVNAIDGAKGDHVHVGWDGVRVNDFPCDNLADVNAMLGSHTLKKARSWMRFPFPLFVIVAYILAGALTGAWGLGLFLFFLIPVYYLMGMAISSKRLGPFLAGMYPLGAVAWFCWMAFVLNQPHPAWVIFLTIPLAEWLIVATSHWWRRRSASPAPKGNT